MRVNRPLYTAFEPTATCALAFKPHGYAAPQFPPDGQTLISWCWRQIWISQAVIYTLIWMDFISAHSVSRSGWILTARSPPEAAPSFSIFQEHPPCGLADIPNASNALMIKQGHSSISQNYLCVGQYVAIHYGACTAAHYKINLRPFLW